MLIPVSETGPSTSRKNPPGESKRPDGTLMEHILAVNKNGVFFLDVETRETVVHFPFPDILSTRRIKSNTDGALYLDMKCGTLLAQRITRIQTAQVKGLFISFSCEPHLTFSTLCFTGSRDCAVDRPLYPHREHNPCF